LDSFNYKKTEFELNHCKIINKSIYIKQTEDENIFLSKKDLINAYEHITCTVPDCDKVKLFINTWTTGNDKIRCYESFGIFPPPLVCPDNVYNLWMPFEAEKIKTYTPNEEALEFILHDLPWTGSSYADDSNPSCLKASSTFPTKPMIDLSIIDFS
jgi:hypothetical protein